MHELLHEGIHMVEHTLLDTVNLIPFLFVPMKASILSVTTGLAAITR